MPAFVAGSSSTRPMRGYDTLTKSTILFSQISMYYSSYSTTSIVKNTQILWKISDSAVGPVNQQAKWASFVLTFFTIWDSFYVLGLLLQHGIHLICEPAMSWRLALLRIYCDKILHSLANRLGLMIQSDSFFRPNVIMKFDFSLCTLTFMCVKRKIQ